MNEPVPPTEAVNAATKGLDRLTSEELIATLYREQRRAVEAIEPALPAIARAVDTIVAALEGGGSLHYFGAGTSGRIGILDAAECPPTFATPPGMVQAHIAGGSDAIVRAVEGAEDRAEAGEAEAARDVRAGDAVVGLSASGSARFVIAAIERSRVAQAATIAMTADADSPLAAAADQTIVVLSGAEALSGSTRLGAGTVAKVVLSMLSTAVMVRLGRVYDNLMVDVVATNVKLRRRAVRLVMQLAPADEARAERLLDSAGGSVKTAIVMHRCNLEADGARERLAAVRGSLRAALDER